jgi:hypothetical protein
MFWNMICLFDVNVIVAIQKCVKSNDFLMKCVDSQYRRCFSLLSKFVCDYEKQIIITNVKSEQHCIICRISSEERKNLESTWSRRTHESTRAQLRQQYIENINKIDDRWIHEIRNFVWSHDLMNIHEIMMINVLHQLLKNMIMHLLNWLRSLLKTEISISKKRKRSKKLSRLDARFKCVTFFTELKIFNHFNRVKQWTKVEQKTIVRQFISVLTSLFINK